MRACLLCLLLTGLLAAAPVRAQAPVPNQAQPHFESVGADSIPRGVVPSMAQDSAGFFWIATGDGLVRFDGYHFQAQQLAEGPAAERNLGWIRQLLAGRDGRVWIGTETRGLAVYDPTSDRIQLVRPEGGPPASALPTIRALAQDRDGAIWIGSVGGGLQRYEPDGGSYSRVQLPDPRVEALLVDRQGRLWIGSWRGLLRLDPGNRLAMAVLTDELEGRRITALHQAADGRIWIGSQHGDLLVLDPETGHHRRLGDRPDPRIASAEAVSSFADVPEGHVWVGRASGIDVHQAGGAAALLQRLRPEPGRDGALKSRQVTQLLRDRAGWIWVSGYGLGLQRYNPGSGAISVLLPRSQPGAADVNVDVRHVLPLASGEVWLATEGGGIAVLDSGLRQVASLRVRPQPGVDQPQVWAMAQAPDGTLWLGAGSELHQYDRGRHLLRVVAHGGGMTRRLHVSADGTVWAGTEDGLYRLRPGAAQAQRMGLMGGRVLPGEVHTIAEAPDHSLWIGCMPGLYRLAADGEALQQVASPAGAGLGNPVVLGLLFDRRGRFWVDTAVAGLHRAEDWRSGELRFTRISERHGVVGRPFGANLLEDERGRIWTHMYVYDPDADRMDELSAADGVSFGTGWFQSFGKHPDGRLLFGGSRGLLVVRPERFEPSTDQPPLVVSELRINGQPQPAAPLLQGLRLEPGQRSFSIAFAALDLSEPHRNRYAYQLQGFDPDWIATGADFRVASYSNLAPGRYLLKLRGSNRSGLWSPRELAIPVEVLPAWWQRWWAKLGLAVLGLAVLAAIVQWRTRQLRRQQQQLELKVRDRTVELEQASLTDPLTGLHNRRFLAQHIATDVALARRRYQDWRPDQPPPLEADLIFLLVDIDHFKSINDRHGHAAGDAVLRQMRERLLSVCRESDYLVRWGGEEFLLVARGSSRAHAGDLAERARRAVAERPFDLSDGQALVVHASAGFACFPPDLAHPAAHSWEATVNLADAALYDAKARGRNAWTGVLRAEGGQAGRSAATWLSSGELAVLRST
ncbi:ligand-binding sensor domain-containing diguanylate cyclase [Pelomonas sp. SE-A7]|uniref:ligand-binding sensor domain-containing diguanylate cyclase n=1 Tax=Pelomonas sp. SE-A7 TaxID=3054953 RepID=UPI00259CF591|nr:ligand-binding sensor domain-containing diguanylate cyclase [Pelomonas sp. SE-A7]MDM4766912.1 diguanylate cyclase [Pelomonas sp. SE-A7]